MKKRIAVIDTETTYYDDVMSIGIVIADSTNLTADMSLYYVFPEECWKPAMYSNVLYYNDQRTIKKFREMGYYASGVHIRNDIYSAFGKQNVALPGVDEFYKHFVALPCGWWME